LPDAVATAARGHAAAVIVSDPQRRLLNGYGVNVDPAQKSKYNEYYGRLDVFAAALGRLPSGLLVSDRAVLTEAQHRGEFYNDWCTLMGLAAPSASIYLIAPMAAAISLSPIPAIRSS
jgi:hypothetical protein